MTSIQKKKEKSWRISIGFVLAMLITITWCDQSNLLACEADGSKPQRTLDSLIADAKANNSAAMDACIASNSVLDLKGFLETKESTNTKESTRRIKLRALTQALLGRIENYSVEAEKDIKVNTKELHVAASVMNPQGPAQQVKILFMFARQRDKWKLADWEGK